MHGMFKVGDLRLILINLCILSVQDLMTKYMYVETT